MKEKIIIYNEAWGFGDVLLLTAGLHSLRLLHPYAIIGCVTRKAEILKYNPDINTLYDELSYPQDAHQHLFSADATIIYVGYHRYRRKLFTQHVLDVIADMLQTPRGEHQLYYYMHPDEESWAIKKIDEIKGKYHRLPVVLIQVNTSYTPNKLWPFGYWTQLVHATPEVTFVQIGAPGEYIIPGAVNLVGQTSARQVIALAKYAETTISPDSFLGHACAAVKKQGMVLFGPTSSAAFGHLSNVNLTRNPIDCMPCFRPAQMELDTIPDPQNKEKRIPWICDHRSCMHGLTPQAVQTTLLHILQTH